MLSMIILYLTFYQDVILSQPSVHLSKIGQNRSSRMNNAIKSEKVFTLIAL